MLEGRATRQALAAAVLVVAAAALLATSPAQPPTNEISDRGSVRAALTPEAPVSSVRVTLSASDEALWSDDPEVAVYRASMYFSATGGWASFADGPARPSDAPDRPIVRLTVVSAESGRPLQDQGSRLGDAGVGLLDACPEFLDCLLEYELIVEWVDPIPGLEVGVEVEASSLIQIQGPVELPPGATAGLEVAEAVARDVSVLSDDVGTSVVIDTEHPLAMWSVAIDANESAIPAALAWPTEARGSFTASIGPVSDQPDAQLEEGDVSILLILDAGDEMSPEVTPWLAQHDFDPFTGCLSDRACQRRLTVVVRWLGFEPGLGAAIDWRLDAGIVFHGDPRPAPDAEVQARIESETLIGDGGPALTAMADGVIELDPSGGGSTEYRNVELHIPRTALAAELLGGPTPAVTGIATVEARSSRAIEGDPAFVFTSIGEQAEEGSMPFSAPDPQINGGSVETPLHPATQCRANRVCESTLSLSARLSDRDLARLGDATVTLTWRIEIRLRYPTDSDPPINAPIRLSHAEP